jgi:hypothetical protein
MNSISAPFFANRLAACIDLIFILILIMKEINASYRGALKTTRAPKLIVKPGMGYSAKEV